MVDNISVKILRSFQCYIVRVFTCNASLETQNPFRNHRLPTLLPKYFNLNLTDSRVEGVDGKIKKLDIELSKYKEQLKVMREGPGKVQ
jgi:hypothetical protein